MQWKKLKFIQERRWIALLLLILGVSVSSWFLYRLALADSGKAVEARLLTVETGKIEDKISSVGTLELAGQRQVKSPAAGTVEEVLVQVGDTVQAGQTLTILRDPESQTKLREHQYTIRLQELDLEQKRQELQTAQTELSNAEKELQKQSLRFREVTSVSLQKKQWEIEKKELQLAQQQQQVASSEAELTEAERKLKADETLLARGFISEDQLQNQKKAVREAQLNLQNLQSQLRLGTIELEEMRLDLQRLQQDIQLGMSETDKDLKNVQEKVQSARQKLQTAQLEVNRTQQELQKLQLQRQKIAAELQNNRVTAPIAGKILAVKVKPGDVVETSGELLTIGDPTQEIVQLKLSTFEAARVKSNQSAQINLIGFGDKSFTGQVKEVSLLATGSENDSLENSSQTGKVLVTVVLNTPSQLIPGSSVSVDIITEQREGVLVVETEAIQQSDSQPFVWGLDSEGEAKQQPVTLGMEGLTKVEVTSGLQSGDKVIIPFPDTPLQPGVLVNPISSPSQPYN